MNPLRHPFAVMGFGIGIGMTGLVQENRVDHQIAALYAETPRLDQAEQLDAEIETLIGNANGYAAVRRYTREPTFKLQYDLLAAEFDGQMAEPDVATAHYRLKAYHATQGLGKAAKHLGLIGICGVLAFLALIGQKSYKKEDNALAPKNA